MNYIIADFLIRLKNAYMARKKDMEYPYARIIASIAKILEEKKYIKNMRLEEKNGKKTLKICLLYKDRKAVMSDVKIVSKPSVRIYVKNNKVPNTKGGFGITIISTNKGVMTDKQAKEKKLGGEVICKVF